jgi:hypothetical protein
MSLVWGKFCYPIASEELYDDFMKEYRLRKERNLEFSLQEGDTISVHKRSSFNFLEGEAYKITTSISEGIFESSDTVRSYK